MQARTFRLMTVDNVPIPTTERLRDAAREIKPKLRGWLHSRAFPLSLVAGIVLVVLSRRRRTGSPTCVFAASSSLLFGSLARSSTAALAPRAGTRAATARPLEHLLAHRRYLHAVRLDPALDGDARGSCCASSGAGLLLGIAFRVLWIGAPRWLYLPVYIALGWAAVFWLGDFATAAGRSCSR